MIAQNLNIPDIRFIPFKNKNNNPHTNIKKSFLTPLTRVLPQRNSAIDWLYRAQKTLTFSRSSLFLAIALLDKLLCLGIALTDSNFELLAGTLTLVVTKFNEVYPVTVRKLNALSNQNYSLEQYIETEANILSIVSYDLSPEDLIYEELAELEHRLGAHSEETIKVAVENPEVAFKMGSVALLGAIESLFSGGIMERKNESRLSRESAELRVELQRLRSRSPSFKRLVSPSRA